MSSRTLRMDLLAVGHAKRPWQMTEEEREDAHVLVIQRHLDKGAEYMANKHAAARDAMRSALQSAPQTEEGRTAAAVKLLQSQVASIPPGTSVDDLEEALNDLHSGFSQLKHDIKHGVK